MSSWNVTNSATTLTVTFTTNEASSISYNDYQPHISEPTEVEEDIAFEDLPIEMQQELEQSLIFRNGDVAFVINDEQHLDYERHRIAHGTPVIITKARDAGSKWGFGYDVRVIGQKGMHRWVSEKNLSKKKPKKLTNYF